MGENTLRRRSGNSIPRSNERSSAESTTPRRYELIRNPAHHEIEPELELVEGLPEPRPQPARIQLARGSVLRFAHTTRRKPPSKALSDPFSADVVTRTVVVIPEGSPVSLPRCQPHAGSPERPLESQHEPRGELPERLQSPQDKQPLPEGPPKWPPAPRTVRSRLARLVFPLALLSLGFGAMAFLLLR
jgi:hypothetical protein